MSCGSADASTGTACVRAAASALTASAPKHSPRSLETALCWLWDFEPVAFQLLFISCLSLAHLDQSTLKSGGTAEVWTVTCWLSPGLWVWAVPCLLHLEGRGWGREVVFKGKFGNDFLSLTCFSGILKVCALSNTLCSVQLNLVLLSQNSVLVEMAWGTFQFTPEHMEFLSGTMLTSPRNFFFSSSRVGLWKESQYFGPRNKINGSIHWCFSHSLARSTASTRSYVEPSLAHVIPSCAIALGIIVN